MKALNIVTLLLLIVGGINWGLIGFFQFDLVAAIFGGQNAAVSRVIYALVGLSAIWQIMPFVQSFTDGEVAAERHRRPAGEPR